MLSKYTNKPSKYCIVRELKKSIHKFNSESQVSYNENMFLKADRASRKWIIWYYMRFKFGVLNSVHPRCAKLQPADFFIILASVSDLFPENCAISYTYLRVQNMAGVVNRQWLSVINCGMWYQTSGKSPLSGTQENLGWD